MTLELDKDVEARLKDAAQRRGQTIAGMLEDVVSALPDDPMLLAFLLAPPDDEPLTDADMAAIEATRADMREEQGIPNEDVRTKLSQRTT